MALSRFLKGSQDSEKSQTEPSPAAEKKQGSPGLAAILQQGISLPPERIALLKKGVEKGREFFDFFNESRLKLAFSSFDEEMKKALYEVLFLIHVNDPSFAELKFTATEIDGRAGVVKESTREAVTNLYLEGAPHGVEGIGNLSPTFKEAFQAHIRGEYDMEVPTTSAFGYTPIKSIHSLGSIGTVGHKSQASDLDLQVQYELEPFYFDISEWSDETFRDALMGEVRFMMNRLRLKQRLPANAFKDPKIKAELNKGAVQQTAKTYPNLYRFLVKKQGDYAQEMASDSGLRSKTLNELIGLMKRTGKISREKELKKEEGLLQERLRLIQEFITLKYPSAEIYLFACSNDDYRLGHHGTTLVSKEASGSAYELILNYETLMPGIQITPMMPAHFIMPKPVNDDPAYYSRIIDYIRFGLLELYSEDRRRLVNLGPTPDLSLDYMGGHSGAVYWEAFKASSGNLPKAILNLFRIEMLLEKRFLKTIIQTIKEPEFMHQFASPRPENVEKEFQKMVQEESGISPWALIDIEEKLPLLKQDPWWLRYKALKIAYHEEDGVAGLDAEERVRVSRVIDTAFALHVRISDIFTKPGDTRPFDSHREQVLIAYFKRAFPENSPRRKYLEHLFVGEIRSVQNFEEEMRDLFKKCLNRANQKIIDMEIQGETNQKEFEIWYHYYQENFEPAANVVQKTILKHLTVSRGRIQIGYIIGEGWFFQSIQRESKLGKRFDTFGHLDHLPEEVMLREKSTFLGGLAECVLNGYYGVMNQGTLKETATIIEFDAKKMDLGNRIDNTMAFLRPDNITSIINKMIETFESKPYDYMDCINNKREVEELILFMNLCKFGRISFLYRDNLQTWYCDEVDHPELFSKAQALHQSPKGLFTAKPVHVTLAKFFKSRGINLNRVKLEIWINPNSLETNHSSRQLALKEKELAIAMTAIINQVHRPKVAPPPQEEAVGGGGAAITGEVPAGGGPPAQDAPPHEDAS